MALTTDWLIQAALGLRRAVEASEQLSELNQKVKVFEAAVWFPHLQAQVVGSDRRGMRGVCRDMKVLTWCCAGRCLIQFERGDSRLTLVTADDEAPWRREMASVAPNMGPMGIQGINAEYVEALKILYLATRYGAEIRLDPDDSVTLG